MIGVIPGGGGPQALDVTGSTVFHLEDKDSSGAAASTNPALCAAQAFSGAFGIDLLNDIQTVLVDGGQLPALVPVVVTFTGTNNAGPGVAMTATINTGPIGAANPVVSLSPGITAYYLVGGVKTPLVGAPVWVQTIGPNAADGINPVPAGGFGIANDDLVSQQNAISCGCDDGDSNGSCSDSVDNPGVSSESYQLQDIVGGFFLDVSSSSLLVAGAQANALWILPILGLAGTLIAIRKLEA